MIERMTATRLRGVVAVLGALGVLAALAGWARTTEAQRGGRIGQSAPEIGGGPWINSEPLTPERLRGRVVYVEFWTYG